MILGLDGETGLALVYKLGLWAALERGVRRFGRLLFFSLKVVASVRWWVHEGAFTDLRFDVGELHEWFFDGEQKNSFIGSGLT